MGIRTRPTSNDTRTPSTTPTHAHTLAHQQHHTHTHTHTHKHWQRPWRFFSTTTSSRRSRFDDSFFGGAFVDATPRTNRCGKVCRPAASRWPKLDLVEKEDGYVLKADVPGIPKDKLKVEVKEGVLTMSSETDEAKEAKTEDGEVIRRERRVSSFTRSVQLPADIDEAKIEASSSDGVLTLSLPKAPQSVPKQIDIN